MALPSQKINGETVNEEKQYIEVWKISGMSMYEAGFKTDEECETYLKKRHEDMGNENLVVATFSEDELGLRFSLKSSYEWLAEPNFSKLYGRF